MESQEIQIEPSWKSRLAQEFREPYMTKLRDFLREEARQKKVIYPKGSEIFQAFGLTPFAQVKVVILGQDPYHGPGQAHGLCFSVQAGQPVPPSLQNIYKELQADLGVPISKKGDLRLWAQQGVLLLNSVLTVERGLAASHRGRGWELFTDRVISLLGQRPEPIVFLLWGAFAQSKAALIQQPPHAILSAPHPSPLSAHRGFLGCRHFSQTNKILQKWGQAPIDWRVER